MLAPQRLLCAILLCGWTSAAWAGAPQAAAPRFEVSFPASVESGPVTGRLIVVAARNDAVEPRHLVWRGAPAGGGRDKPALFGIDVSALQPGAVVLVDDRADSFPVEPGLLPPGEYFVQAVLIRYTEARRSDGHVIWVPITDRIVPAAALPGNLYSEVAKVRIDPAAGAAIRLSLGQVIGPIPEPQDTQWLRHVKIRSEILSRFWGVPMHLRATVLVPRGFDEHPEARYPAVYTFGHHSAPFSFNPDPASHERALAGARDANVETGYELYQSWISDDFPRVVAITIEHPSPYFIESYAINSANNGPYGDALTRELIPYLERQFRLIPESYARIVEGASTGGWEALALQLHYPDFFGGAWVFNPDPIDFRRYQLVDIYRDENMFSVRLDAWRQAERPFRRTREGQPLGSVRELARFESVLGSRGRSGFQLGIWQATHGPVGPDGYPVPLFDPKTGVIDKRVAEYMREHGYDLSAYARRNWETLGPKLAGKLHLFAGEMDDFYLNLAVYAFQAMLAEVAGPDYPARFEYGRPKKGHNWHHTNWAGVIREMARHIARSAPQDADTAQWSY